jgi:Domain of unknown function (DUF6249)
MSRFLVIGLALMASLTALGDEEPSINVHLNSHIETALFWGTSLAIVAIVFMFLWLRERGRLELARTLVEHGKELPPQLLAPSRRRRPNSDLRRGILGVMIGLGMAASFMLSEHRSHWALSLIPGLVGVGYLLIWRLEPPPSDPPGQ